MTQKSNLLENYNYSKKNEVTLPQRIRGLIGVVNVRLMRCSGEAIQWLSAD